MLRFALDYHDPIDAITANKSLKICKYELDNTQWEIVEDLVSVLEVTLFLSFRHQWLKQDFSNTRRQLYSFQATQVNVIPAMDKLDATFNPCTKNAYHRAIVAAMSLARKKLNRYYELTDLSDPYRISMSKFYYLMYGAVAHICSQVLHPGLKLEYFRKQEWEPKWIENAELITRDAFTCYKGLGSADEPGIMLVDEVCCFVVNKILSTHFNCRMTNFGNISVGTIPVQLSELDKYLNSNTVKIANPLKWWTENSHTYSQLSRMALDYLSIPGRFQQSISLHNY